ncbi:MAG: hypothetical protein HY835_10420 [Anaerolineae bacterium]|nr:hypothetical protein [Anaerolineae bacterium]
MKPASYLYQAAQTLKRIGGRQVVSISKRLKASPWILSQALGVYLILVAAPMAIELGFSEDECPVCCCRCSYSPDCFQAVGVPCSFAGDNGHDFAIDGGGKGRSGSAALGESIGKDADENSGTKTGDETADRIDDRDREKLNKLVHGFLFLFILGVASWAILEFIAIVF